SGQRAPPAAYRARRRHTVRSRPAVRMPVPDAMLEGAGCLRRGGTGVDRQGPRPPDRMSFRRGGSRRMTRAYRGATVLLAVALVAGACSGGTSSQTSKPARGGVLRVGITSGDSLDPAQANTVEQLLVADQLFDGLTAFDPKTKTVV